MGAIGYLYWRVMINRARQALRRPVTYIYLLIFLFYLFAVPVSLRSIAESRGWNTPQGMVNVMTMFAFWSIPANLIAYSNRRGLVYRNCDVHFLFPSPVSPKKVLVYAHARTLAAQILLNLFLIACGRTVFQVSGWRLCFFFLFSIIGENLLEGSIMLLLYGSEKLGEKQRGMIVKAAYGITGILVLMGIYAYLKGGMNWRMVSDYLNSNRVQMVPLVGWYIAILHLLLLGATPVNVAGTVCYGLLLGAVLIAAWRMKCTGSFYEDAMKFADDYEEMLESRRQGNISGRLGKKRKLGKANVKWRGYGARALFYRQLLEYKKRKYFIFDGNTLLFFLAGAGIAFLYVHEGGFGALGKFAPFVIPVVSSYLIFVFVVFNGKWARELSSPYTYLIPDTPFSKMMNATGIQLLQSLLNACLITLPGAVIMGLPLSITGMCILFCFAMAANKLYVLVVAEAVCGKTLGKVGRQLFQMLIQGIGISGAVITGTLGMGAGGVASAYMLMDIFMILFTAVFIVLATLNFYNMETV